MGYGFLLDTRDVINPKRVDVAADSNFAFWHSATFNNDGTKLVFTDEWGGGQGARCRATDKPEWGADAIFTISKRKLTQHAYYKMPAAQTPFENCVAHNGSLIPVPGRDILVQGWYQGGISVVDFTDAAHPKEIAFFDRGPVDSTKLVSFAGVWSAYWYNGVIVSSEISRGLDVLQLLPSDLLSQNEIDAASLVHLDQFNAQVQEPFTWPASFAVARAYVDQLARGSSLAANEIAGVRRDLEAAERVSGTRDGRRSLGWRLVSTASRRVDLMRHACAHSSRRFESSRCQLRQLLQKLREMILPDRGQRMRPVAARLVRRGKQHVSRMLHARNQLLHHAELRRIDEVVGRIDREHVRRDLLEVR
jgi:hypothetical protein